jgi:hypothetical protein
MFMLRQFLPLCDDQLLWREDDVPLIRSHTNPDEYT